MKNNTKNILRLSTGVLLISTTLILSHYSLISDWWEGILTGVAFGLMILGIIKLFNEKKNRDIAENHH